MDVFQDYAYYYNSFYKDKNYREEAGTVDKILKKYAPGVKSIINFGCGTGRHDIELAKLGYHCKGIDKSPQMVGIARENAGSGGVSVDFEIVDIRDYKGGETYDAVISLFHVMSYQNTNEDILRTFRSARSVLGQTGSLFLFDVWYGPGVLSDKPGVRIKEAEDDAYRLVRLAKPVMHDKENVVEVNYEVFAINKASGLVQAINEVHHMRYFFRPELEWLLAEAGFELLDHMDCQTLGETDYHSWTSYFVAKPV